jgi:hypothetical protein
LPRWYTSVPPGSFESARAQCGAQRFVLDQETYRIRHGTDVQRVDDESCIAADLGERAAVAHQGRRSQGHGFDRR